MVSSEQQLFQLLQKNFDLTTIEGRQQENIHDLLRPVIQHLVDHQFDKLLTILYRIDFDELRFKQIISESSTKDLYDTLTSEIIERQMQKIEYRKNYKS